MFKPNKLLPIIGVFLLPILSDAAESSLWGMNGELWDNSYPSNSISSRITDCSHAGYQGGDEPIPFYPVAITVTDAPYNAVPNDGIDDSAAIQAAIDACPTNTGAAVYIPEGTFDVTNTLFLSVPNVVLRGAGPEKTVLRVQNERIGILMEGNIINDGGAQVKDFFRGDQQIDNSGLAGKAQVGDLAYLTITLSTAHDSAYSNLIEQTVGGVQIPQFLGRIAPKMYGKVTHISGTVVSLDRPFEFSYQGPTLSGSSKKWGIGILRPQLHDSGIEDLTITYDPDYPYAKHFNGTAPGPVNEEDTDSHAIYLRGCVNCWARNLVIKEACEALSSYGENVQCTFSDITLEATRMSQSEFPLDSGYDFDYAMQFDTPLVSKYWDVQAHAGVQLAGSHMLAERIDMKYAALHGLTINATDNSVFSDIKCFDASLDHHRQNGSRNLWTDIDAGLGRMLWLSSGVNVDGIQCGAWETFWNIDSALEQDFPSWAPTGNAFCRGYINLVGINTLADPVTNAAPRWFEANIAPDEIAQPNLFQAMRIKRFAENGWDSVPPTAVASADATQGLGSLTVNFTGSNSSDNVGIASTLWKFGDGYTSRASNPQHTYAVPGTYTATLTVCDGRMLYDTAEVEITVLEPDAQYDRTYRLAGSARLENFAINAGHALAGATNQVVAEGASAGTMIAVPGSGYRFVAWSDGVKTAARTDTNVTASAELTAYFMEGNSPWVANGPSDLTLDTNVINENATNGTLIGTVTATDPDAGETFTYGLIDDAGGRFVIDPHSGRLSVADTSAIIHASNATHSITVAVADSTSEVYREDFIIAVTSDSLPSAYLQSLTIPQNGDAGIRLSGSDPEGDALSYIITRQPTNGTLIGSAPNLIYTPNPDYTGPDSFSFKVTDGYTESDDALISIQVRSILSGSTELLVNGSFEGGASNFNFAGSAGNIALTESMAGQWVVREASQDSNMDLADTSGVVSGQDGSVAMMFQITSKRGLVQVIDVSNFDISGMELNFSASFVAPGREGLSSSDMACYQVVGFNTFTGLSVDLGGDYSFTGGSYSDVVAKRTLADTDVSNSTYTPFSETTVMNSDYNYLAVLLGGVANAANNNAQFIGVDAVQLALNSLESNAAPVAADAQVEVTQNGTANIMLPASDADGDTLVYMISGQPTHGMLDGIAPELTYTPDTGYAGPDSLSFYVNDGTTGSPTATVSITVSGAPLPPASTGTVSVVIASPAANSNILTGAEGIQTRSREVIRTDSQKFAVGQSFGLPALQAGESYALNEIYLKSKTSENFDGYPGQLQIKVFAGTLGSANLLATYSYDLSTFGDGTGASDVANGDWVQFGLGSGLVLTNGGSYSFLLFFDSTDAAHKWGFYRDDSGIYAGSNQFEDTTYNPADWDSNPWNGVAADSNDDFMFYIGGSVIAGDPDTDGDGLTDAQEIALGTNPNDPASGFGIGGTPLPMSGKFQITWPSATGVLYRVWESPDLTSWSVVRDWTNAAAVPVDAYELNLTPSNGFFKVEAEIQ